MHSLGILVSAATMVALCGQLEHAVAATKCCQQRDDKGFTRDFPNTGDQFDNVITTPVIGDLNGDGSKEILFLRDHFLHGLDSSGNDLPNFPIDLVQLAGATGHQSLPSYPLALGDFTHDGRQQIIVYINVRFPDRGVLFILNGDGTVFETWPAQGLVVGSFAGSSPTVRDLDGDGIPEIILGGYAPGQGGILHVLKADGSSFRPQFPLIFHGFGIASTSAVGDLDGDGVLDIVVLDGNSHLHALRSSDGSELPGWPVFLDSGFTSFRNAPVLGDVNADGVLEVVATADDEIAFVLDARGQLLPGWPVRLTGPLSTPTLANLDDAPDLEILFTSRGSPFAPQLNIYKADGSVFPGWPQAVSEAPIFQSNITIADLNGDGLKDVVFTATQGDWYIWNADGTLFPDFPKMFVVPDKATNNWSNPVITDLFGDGHREVAFTLFFNRLNDPTNFSRIIVTDLNVCSPETDEDWVTFHKNNQRTGVTP